MSIAKFTNDTAAIILDYLSPPLSAGAPSASSKKKGQLVLSELARLRFKDYWQNTIWRSHTKAEHLLNQVLYTGSGMDVAVKSYSNQSLSKALELSTTVRTVMGSTRIMFVEQDFGVSAYPMLIDVARNWQGGKLVAAVNEMLKSIGQCLIVHNTKQPSTSSYDDLVFAAIHLNLTDYAETILEDQRGDWHLQPLSMDRIFFHECSHVFHRLQAPIITAPSSLRWTSAEERVTIREENTFALCQEEGCRVTHLSLKERTTKYNLFEVALSWGAYGTLSRLLESTSQNQAQFMEGLNLDPSMPTSKNAYLIIFNYYTCPLSSIRPTSTIEDEDFSSEIALRKVDCYQTLKETLYRLKMHSQLFELKRQEACFESTGRFLN